MNKKLLIILLANFYICAHANQHITRSCHFHLAKVKGPLNIEKTSLKAPSSLIDKKTGKFKSEIFDESFEMANYIRREIKDHLYISVGGNVSVLENVLFSTSNQKNIFSSLPNFNFKTKLSDPLSGIKEFSTNEILNDPERKAKLYTIFNEMISPFTIKQLKKNNLLLIFSPEQKRFGNNLLKINTLLQHYILDDEGLKKYIAFNNQSIPKNSIQTIKRKLGINNLFIKSNPEEVQEFFNIANNKAYQTTYTFTIDDNHYKSISDLNSSELGKWNKYNVIDNSKGPLFKEIRNISIQRYLHINYHHQIHYILENSL